MVFLTFYPPPRPSAAAQPLVLSKSFGLLFSMGCNASSTVDDVSKVEPLPGKEATPPPTGEDPADESSMINDEEFAAAQLGAMGLDD